MTQILLVEDEPGIQLAMRGLLRRDGYEVRVASTGKEALEAIEGDGCDLVLTDLSLADGVSGLDVARRARSTQPPTPVILITAYGSDEIASEAEAAGVFDYVPKPFDNQVVRDVVRRALGR
ncbi:MAG: response regulator [Myxococcota bacterium]|jgi:two-component system response regulator PilR (NtrC family)